MREIKFRGMIKGKNDKKDQWVYGYLTRDKKCNWMEVAEDDGYLYFIKHSDIVSTQVKLETVGQYTSLHDRNGKEIYEGDIVKKRDLIDAVEWFEPNTGFIPFAGGCGEWDSKLCEVIGNICENPDLLPLASEGKGRI